MIFSVMPSNWLVNAIGFAVDANFYPEHNYVYYSKKRITVNIVGKNIR